MFGLTERALGDGHALLVGSLPPELVPTAHEFEALWNLHPPTFHEIRMLGRTIPTPRWQQAYGRDYRYTGSVNRALPVPPELRRFLDAAQAAVDARLNGLLLNCYDGDLKHRIGPHRDSTHGMVHGAPIVTISLGSSRHFRLRPWRGTGTIDFATGNGTVLVMPYATNLAWSHEVPHRARDRGRRISITVRAFE